MSLLRKESLPYYFSVLMIVAGLAYLKLSLGKLQAQDLKWVLLPTASLVEFFTPLDFIFETGRGYVDQRHEIVVNEGCSGVNFFISASLVLLSLVWLTPKLSSGRRIILSWLSLPAALVWTFSANTCRITAAFSIMRLQKMQTALMLPLGGDELHRIIGVVVYFSFLLALSALYYHYLYRRHSL